MDDKTIKVGQQVLNQDDINKVITVGKESFKIKLPTPFIQQTIEREIAMRLGSPVDSFPINAYNMIRMCVTLDAVLIDTPDWWTTAGECYDDGMLNDLWDKYLEEKETFRRSLREGKVKRPS